jgi:beta-galactosidase/beta-glucuronidase
MTLLIPKGTASMPTVVPKAEYPRPDRDRSDRWVSLNGEWGFTTDEGTSRIIVPFSWETAASGVERTWLEHAGYQRQIEVPSSWRGDRVFLCFGAVHHRATVFLGGVEVGRHVGGYTSFEFDITDHVVAGESIDLIVDVEAPNDKRAIPHGKQRSIPRDDYDGVSFRPTSGIWQSVWLEARGRTWVSSIELRGDSLTGLDIAGALGGDAAAGAGIQISVVEGSEAQESIELEAGPDGRFRGRLELAHPRVWSPSDPHLYALSVSVATEGSVDRMIVTTGLRSIEVRGEQLVLNGSRFYLKGVLDQGYWPDSGPTAPDDDALRRDLHLARELGFNLVRKHLKFEEPRWLHYADQLGMLVWAEPACPSRFSPEAAAAFEAQLAPMVERDGNHPSIIIWGLYNEEWGLDWDIPGSPERADAARHAYDAMTSLDRSRPVVENSGWAHVRSDLVDWHYYDDDPAAWAESLAALAAGSRESFPVKLGPDFLVDKSFYGSDDFPRTGVPILNSEYGAGFTSLERAWHVRWQTQELRRHDRFAGYVYTELADVEHEAAGLVDADRRAKDRGGLNPVDANAETVLIVDLIPRHAGADIEMPDSAFPLGLHVSHHGADPVSGHIRGAWVAAGRPFADSVPPHSFSSATVFATPFQVTDAATITVDPPASPATAARLLLWFVDEQERVRARTFVDAAPIEPPNRRGSRG